MFKPSSLPWPVSRDRGLMYFCIYVYVPCAVLWLLSLLFPLVSLCVFIYVRTPGCFGSQRDCNPEVFLRWKLPHLPLISHRQLQLMASFRAPYLRVWLSQTHQDCRDSYSLKTSLWKGLRGHRFVFCMFGTRVCFTGAEPQVGNGRFWSCYFHLFHWHSHSVGFWENCHK